MNQSPWWSSETFWRKTAIWVTAGMIVVLIMLTFDTVRQITAGGERVPAYSVINQKVFYVQDDNRGYQVPRIGGAAPLFGKSLTEEESESLVTKGKLTVQAKNCINCHTLLGNGAYFAPDLTKAWLDPGWINESIREELMLNWSGRRMPDLNITEEEAKAIVAFLKWMSAIDTNGFPRGFQPLDQEDEA
jgi:nitric oxide reductase subunit C